MNPKIFVALDIDDPQKAIQLSDQLSHPEVGFKLGPRLISRHGEALIKKIAERGSVFVDQKFFDIPNTMVSSVQTIFDAGATYATIHSLAGPEALHRLAALSADLNKVRPFQILAVTILTSFHGDNLPWGLQEHSIEDLVANLARQTMDSGLGGLVCSGSEVEVLKAKYPTGYFVVPGIRPLGLSSHDQKRVTTPKEAIKKGASSIVVGRPILEAKDPVRALAQILEEINS